MKSRHSWLYSKLQYNAQQHTIRLCRLETRRVLRNFKSFFIFSFLNDEHRWMSALCFWRRLYVCTVYTHSDENQKQNSIILRIFPKYLTKRVKEKSLNSSYIVLCIFPISWAKLVYVRRLWVLKWNHRTFPNASAHFLLFFTENFRWSKITWLSILCSGNERANERDLKIQNRRLYRAALSMIWKKRTFNTTETDVNNNQKKKLNGVDRVCCVFVSRINILLYFFLRRSICKRK